VSSSKRPRNEDSNDDFEEEEDIIVNEDETLDWGKLISKANTKTPVWDNFLVYEKMRNYAKCQIMGCKFSVIKIAKNQKDNISTSKLSLHMKRHHSKIVRNSLQDDSESRLLNELKEYNGSSLTNLSSNKGKITSHFMLKATDSGFPQAYAEWVVDTYQPLDTCTRNSFRLMCKSLNSRADVTLGKDRVMDILMRMEADVQATLKIMVKDIHSIAITCDGWTSKANESYTAVTGMAG
jgi:hypothetical protein